MDTKKILKDAENAIKNKEKVEKTIGFKQALSLVKEMKPVSGVIAKKSNGKCELSKKLIAEQQNMAKYPTEPNVLIVKNIFISWKELYKSEL